MRKFQVLDTADWMTKWQPTLSLPTAVDNTALDFLLGEEKRGFGATKQRHGRSLLVRRKDDVYREAMPQGIPNGQPAAFWAAVMDSIQDAIVTFDRGGIVTTWNAAAQRFYGPSPAEAIGKHFNKLPFPAELAPFLAKIEGFDGKGEAGAIDPVRVQRDGRETWLGVALSPIRLEGGEAAGLLMIARDVSAATLARQKESESSRRLQMIIENAREYAIFSLDFDRTVTSWNRGAEALLGYTQDEIMGRSADVIFTPEDREAGGPAREVLMASTQGRSADERWHMRKDGTRFWGSGIMMQMFDADQKPAGLVKIFRDQTEEIKAKEALERSLLETEKARAEVEEAGRVKDRFFALVSHELRTPLTPIVMAVETLCRSKEFSPAHLSVLAMIKRNVELEVRFIDDLLDVTRIAHGKLELAYSPADVHDIIRQAADVARPDIEAKNQSLSLFLDAAASRMEGDSARLQQVFWNLLKNASKFTPEGGAIKVQSRNQDGPDGKWLLIDIDDTGIGFEPDVREKIFEAFAQGDATVTRRYGGLGLGLAISKAAVEAHDGRLSAHSGGPGHGAVFSVELPLTPFAGKPN